MENNKKNFKNIYKHGMERVIFFTIYMNHFLYLIEYIENIKHDNVTFYL